jgi:hypothetical protein
MVAPPIPAHAVRIHVELGLSGMVYDLVVFFARLKAAKDDASLRLRHAGQAYALRFSVNVHWTLLS